MQYDADISDTKARNQARMVASKAAFEEAHRLWMQVVLLSVKNGISVLITINGYFQDATPRR